MQKKWGIKEESEWKCSGESKSTKWGTASSTTHTHTLLTVYGGFLILAYELIGKQWRIALVHMSELMRHPICYACAYTSTQSITMHSPCNTINSTTVWPRKCRWVHSPQFQNYFTSDSYSRLNRSQMGLTHDITKWINQII